MKNSQSCQIWSLSSTKAEYERFDYLLSKKEGGIDTDLLMALLRERALSNVEDSPSLTVIHDPCSIRKKDSYKMEKLDRVQDLNGKTINGYRTFNSVLLNGSKLALLACRPYSQKEASLEDETAHLSNKEVSFKEIKLISESLKADFPARKITHLFDREADDSAYFELIDKELKDLFIFRLKTNRNSDVEYWNEEKGKLYPVKLHLKELKNSFKTTFEKYIHRGKCHQNVQATISYEDTWVGQDYYRVLKIELKNRKGRAIFAKPMMLITNYQIESEEVALFIFQKYLKRSKIEAVFKFLKQELGWENFQIRNFQAIKNILALGFFVGAYFCENQELLIENPLIVTICQLAKNKGVVSKHFFMKGLIILTHMKIAQDFFQQQNLTEKQIQDIMKFIE